MCARKPKNRKLSLDPLLLRPEAMAIEADDSAAEMAADHDFFFFEGVRIDAMYRSYSALQDVLIKTFFIQLALIAL